MRAGRKRCIPLNIGIRLAASVRMILSGQPVSLAPSWVIIFLNLLAILDCILLNAVSLRSALYPVIRV